MKRVELLSPAGGMEQFKAAVEYGADAVYLGGSMFNARIGAGNFTLDEIKSAVDYGHLRNVKTYVTMNTLIFDNELKQAVEYAAKLYEAGADALIIQDLGLGYIIRKLMPEFELHLSTQATVYNAKGVRAALELGYSRAVIAREVSIEEIKECCKLGEIEVFVHGALCICYSGQCQMSRNIGGRSGNRGMCAQPCRLPYIYEDEEGNNLGEKYPLSPKDLCRIDNLGELIEAGASSLKIEGRMKSPEYVGLVTSIYRKYIDEYYKNGRYTVSEQDRNDLLQAFNRGGFTEGYIHGDPREELMSSQIPKNQGILAGKVTSVKKGGKYIEVELSRSLNMQDIIEIRPSKNNQRISRNIFDNSSYGVSAKVTYLRNEGADKAVIGDIKGEVGKGDEVYRIVSEELKSRFSLRNASETEKRKAGVRMTLLAKRGHGLKLTVSDIWTGISVTEVSDGYEVETARGKGTGKGEMIAQLSKTGNTPFFAENIRIIADEDIFIPVSKLNELRRNVLEKLEKSKQEFFDGRISDEEKSKIATELENLHENILETSIFGESGEKVISKSAEFGESGKYGEYPALPYISGRGFIESHASTYSNGSIAGEKAGCETEAVNGATVVANNISQIKDLFDWGIKVVGGRGLNITNRAAAEAYMSLGMSGEYLSSAELLDREEMGDILLMISEHEMKPGTLTDRKGAKYRVEFDKENHKTYIYNKNPLG